MNDIVVVCCSLNTDKCVAVADKFDYVNCRFRGVFRGRQVTSC